MSKSNNEYPPEYEAFWDPYPRKIEKKDAYITWKRLTKKQKKEVIVASKNYALAMKLEGREIKYIKHPKTFLNPKAERWKDYLVAPKQKEETPRTGWAERYRQQRGDVPK